MTHRKITVSLIAVATGASLILGVLPVAAADIDTNAAGMVNSSAGGVSVGASANVDASVSSNSNNSDSASNTNSNGDVRNRGGDGKNIELRRDLASTSSSTRAANQVNRIDDRSAAQIDARIKTLTKLNARVQAMAKLSATEKSNVSSEVSTTIADLTSLKAKIGVDTDATSMRADEKTIMTTFRVYALLVPQGYIEAAVDRIQTMDTMLTTIGTKLQTRITAAQAAGKDTASIQANLTEFNAKVSDSGVQATAALNLVVNLKADNGDAAVAKANQAALVAARAAIKTAVADLDTARKDAKTIIAALKGFNLDVSASSTTTVR